MPNDLDNAIGQAKAQYESIREMVLELRAAETDDEVESAERAIQEDALSVEIRNGWRTPGGEDEGAEEFRILLCTGGPAVQIRGKLGNYAEPESAWLECQDWFQPWTVVNKLGEDSAEILLDYCRQFYFGE